MSQDFPIENEAALLAYLAERDRLTMVLNRRSLVDRLETAHERLCEHGGGGALCFINLDGFRVINETYGFASGDQILVAVAGRLSDTAGPADSVGRAGADDFFFMAERPITPGSAEQLGSDLLNAIRFPCLIDSSHGEVEVIQTASIGVAIWGNAFSNAQDWVRGGELACSTAKGRGGNQVVILNPGMK